jgi:poly(3-hydroxybutyrate) depolymerase
MSFSRLLVAMVLALGIAEPAQALEQVALTSRDGTTLSGWFSKPDGPGPFPAVVSLHGCAGLWTASGKLSARERLECAAGQRGLCGAAAGQFSRARRVEPLQ